jgi:hypothetical protein
VKEEVKEVKEVKDLEFGAVVAGRTVWANQFRL